jgi:F420-non-reducing hydrogenase iron-sulfur subunit
MLLNLLEQFGIERDRVWLEWISASEGDKFAETVTKMTERLKELGPLNWRERAGALHGAPQGGNGDG